MCRRGTTCPWLNKCSSDIIRELIYWWIHHFLGYFLVMKNNRKWNLLHGKSRSLTLKEMFITSHSLIEWMFPGHHEESSFISQFIFVLTFCFSIAQRQWIQATTDWNSVTMSPNNVSTFKLIVLGVLLQYTYAWLLQMLTVNVAWVKQMLLDNIKFGGFLLVLYTDCWHLFWGFHFVCLHCTTVGKTSLRSRF